ncbi:MAG: DUF5009 domain-containing protein [Chitinophagaceae bacterium]|jgi:predicted acyltransferase|nr:DUF5009 domain-containing protein [Chitinophagaceae bacterium]OQY95239.1 MAG: DUF5009 domain-containing protein [Sphingobacteriales bacterium UTBCD1]
MEQIVTKGRLFSLDALRGFDMFWIMGLGELIEKYAKTKNTPFWNTVAYHFEHPYWNGFAFWDLIFPLFMFLAGVSTVYSLDRQLEKGKHRSQLLFKVVKRGIVLILLGMIYNNGLELRPLAEFRFPSVLGKIGATYIFANIIYLYAGKRMQWVWFWLFLVGYWLLLKFTSAPGYLPGDLTEQGNFMSYIDRSVLPGKLSRGIHDTVGLVCTIPGISTVLLGIFAGRFLKNNPGSSAAKAKWLAIAGVISLAIAFIWNIDFPFNKNLWSSSFVMLTGGLSLILLSVFYFIIDVRGYKRWTFFFRVIGMNSILIYMSIRFIDWQYMTEGFFKWAGQWVGPPNGEYLLALLDTGLRWLFLYFLYKKRVFLRV